MLCMGRVLRDNASGFIEPKGFASEHVTEGRIDETVNGRMDE